MVAAWVLLAVPILAQAPAGPQPPPGPDVSIRVELNQASEVDVVALVARLAGALGLDVQTPPGPVHLPLAGLAAPLTRSLLADTLGPEARLDFGPGALVVAIPRDAPRDAWRKRLGDLAGRAARVDARQARYGFKARPSYRPNDPARPTVCLVHGLNSTAGVFVHFFAPLEAAGYGVVTYDYPYNRDLDETSSAFARDWAAFRSRLGDRLPWGIVAHSMGSLLARSYVEDDRAYARDVSALVLIAPPNHGSALARGQTLLQMTESLRAARGDRRSDPLSGLGDGLGAAAEDMMPGSAYLDRLNARPRRAGVRTVILAGDRGYLTATARRQIDAQATGGGLLGGLGRLALAGTAEALDAITDGRGDGCVSVRSTRLEGADPPRVFPLNHLELIRAPLLFPDPGPVPTMPAILEGLTGPAAGR